MHYEKTVNLFGSRSPEDFYVCQVPQRYRVEEWAQNADPASKEANWCAMCCVRGILLATRAAKVTPIDVLFKLACDSGVYRQRSVGWSGAYHHELAFFIAEVCQRPAFARRRMSTAYIEDALSRGFFCILSAHPDIRLRNSVVPATKRGHMVLVYGYVIDKKGDVHFLINNSAGFQSQKSQVGMRISRQRLEDVSCGDGVIVHSTQYFLPHC